MDDDLNIATNMSLSLSRSLMMYGGLWFFLISKDLSMFSGGA